jgi:hypothetical protein
LGAEEANAAYAGRPDDRPWSERHPAVLWVAIIMVVLILGGIALRSMKTATTQGFRQANSALYYWSDFIRCLPLDPADLVIRSRLACICTNTAPLIICFHGFEAALLLDK